MAHEHPSNCRTIRLISRLALALVFLLLAIPGFAAPSLALYYGASPPVSELKAFDIVVLDPDTDFKPDRLQPAEVLAYVSVGEADPGREYSKRLPANWLIGDNPTWGTKVLDQSNPAWRTFFIDEVLAPLWQRGYRGFFFDTMDTYHLAAVTTAEKARQEQGLVALVRAAKARFPDAKLILNRGFEILPQVHDQVCAVAAESLFGGWDQAARAYRAVPEADRNWLLAQLQKARELGLETYAIDYAPPADRQRARDYARQILAAGVEPYVTDGGLRAVGIGRIEPVRRRIMVLYDEGQRVDVALSQACRLGSMPLQYLGYTPEFTDLRQPQPDAVPDYAGVVVWLTGNGTPSPAWLDWLDRQREQGVPVVFLGPGLPPVTGRPGWRLERGDPADPQAASPLMAKNAAASFEVPPPQQMVGVQALAAKGGEPWLEYGRGEGQGFDPVAITPWGGYALMPYTLVTLPAVLGREAVSRWVIDPIRFFAAALRTGAAPVPDATTAAGRRVLMVHIDGDGFPSRAELPGSPYAGQVLLDRVLEQYRVPTAMSVIEGEIAPDGLHPREAPQLEAIARRMYRLPYVEAASHTYSHPFRWKKVETLDPEASGAYHLDIPGYKFDLEKEVMGSIRYIDDHLLPPGKKAKMLFWSGDTTPSAEVLRYTESQGLLNLNGGYTVITRSNPSLTAVEGMYVDKDGAIQVFAPNQNENVYTNLWQGPFYGYERVIETFQMTETPRRLKPIDIYYHTYSATKQASLKALSKVYDWALAQPVHPLFASEYVRSVLDFVDLSVARTARGYRIRGARDLRTVRLPENAPPIDWAASTNVAGEAPGPGGRYVSLAGDEAEIVFAAQASPLPYLVSANGRVDQARWRGRNLHLAFDGRLPLAWAVHHPPGCHFTADGRPLKPVRQRDGISEFTSPAHALSAFDVICSP